MSWHRFMTGLEMGTKPAKVAHRPSWPTKTAKVCRFCATKTPPPQGFAPRADQSCSTFRPAAAASLVLRPLWAEEQPERQPTHSCCSAAAWVTHLAQLGRYRRIRSMLDRQLDRGSPSHWAASSRLWLCRGPLPTQPRPPHSLQSP